MICFRGAVRTQEAPLPLRPLPRPKLPHGPHVGDRAERRVRLPAAPRVHGARHGRARDPNGASRPHGGWPNIRTHFELPNTAPHPLPPRSNTRRPPSARSERTGARGPIPSRGRPKRATGRHWIPLTGGWARYDPGRASSCPPTAAPRPASHLAPRRCLPYCRRCSS